MTETKKVSWKDEVELDFTKVKARDIAQLANASADPAKAYQAMAELMAAVVKKAPIEGDVSDPETYLDMPQFGDSDDALSWQTLTTHINTTMTQRLKG